MKLQSLTTHVAAAGLVSLVLLVMYITQQQQYRGNANDPQVQICEDIRHLLLRHQSIENIFPTNNIDIAESLSPFALLYDQQGKPIRSSAQLNGAAPQLPAGVFDYVRKHGEERVSWQPRQGLRMAMVIQSLDQDGVGFVAAGRSLREVEIKEQNLMRIIFVVWLLSMGLIALHAIAQIIFDQRERKKIIITRGKALE